MADTHRFQRRALVAEDDRTLADVVRFALERADFQVTVAHSGRQALDLASAERFDVISSDYQMPVLNGEQLLSAIRAGGPSRDATLILCSAKCYELDSERLRRELQLAAVFYKPFSLVQLAATATTGKEADIFS